MRVALVTSAFHPAVGGVENHVRSLARGLSARGDDVTVVTHRLRPDDPAVEQDEGLLVRRFPLTVTATNYRWSAALARYLRASGDGFDIVHVHSYHTLVGVNAVLAGVRPLVFTPHYHGTGHTRFRAALHRPYRAVGRRVLRRSRAVVCVSQAEARRLTADFPDVADRVVVIPNGTRPRGVTAPRARGVVVTAQDVLAIGRLEHYKRNDLLLGALERLPAPARLVLVGEGPARTDLEEQARRLGLGHRVLFAGRLPDDEVEAALRSAGVVASMSQHEAFGLSVADGLAAGARVVASDIPAHREVVELGGDPAAGVLVPGQPEQLAHALARALAAGRPERPARLPSWDDVVARTRDLYDEVGAS